MIIMNARRRGVKSKNNREVADLPAQDHPAAGQKTVPEILIASNDRQPWENHAIYLEDENFESKTSKKKQ